MPRHSARFAAPSLVPEIPGNPRRRRSPRLPGRPQPGRDSPLGKFAGRCTSREPQAIKQTSDRGAHFASRRPDHVSAGHRREVADACVEAPVPDQEGRDATASRCRLVRLGGMGLPVGQDKHIPPPGPGYGIDGRPEFVPPFGAPIR